MSRPVTFAAAAFEDFNQWALENKKIYKKIVELIRDIDRSPFQGLGKPEPLKHELQGYWSRRITQEHRLVYKVSDDAIIIIACKYHY
ncbi:MAG: Txe/YoeB family addiction module toxin [Cyanobacteria bacterium J06632_22]